jgi:hypothetical protein
MPEKRVLVAVGPSAGGVEAVRALMAGFPQDHPKTSPPPWHRCRVGHSWSPDRLLDEQAVGTTVRLITTQLGSARLRPMSPSSPATAHVTSGNLTSARVVIPGEQCKP